LAFAGEPSVETFTDKRDGLKYKAVTIGQQTWMAQNLNFKTPGGSWCYNNDTSYCNKYGRLYDWNTAMRVCPAGFHLPSRQEWGNLAALGNGAVGGRMLKAKNGWGWNFYTAAGTDDFGFSAMPGGNRNSNGNFGYAGDNGVWWTATEDGASNAYYRSMYYDVNYVYDGAYGKSNGYSVRCVADSK